MSVSSRLKRYNVFPHLVAQDLAFGVEYTPINTLTINDGAVGASALRQDAAAAALRGNNEGAATINRVAAATAGSAEPFLVDQTATYKPPANAKSPSRISGPLKITSFPLDLTTKQGIPYVLFKIFKSETGPVEATDDTTLSLATGATRAVQVITGIPGANAAAAAVFGGQVAGAAGAIAAAIATTDTGQGGIDAIGNQIFGADVNITTRAKELVKGFALKRNITQLEQAIALFMPDGITSNYDHEYDALSVTATLGAAGFAAQAVGSVNGQVDVANPYIAEAAASLVSKVIGGEDFAKLGLFATTGYVRNPQMELIYSSPVLRKFIFDFRLIPRNSNESIAILEVIRDLKYHSAPDLLFGSGGRYLIPPSQFEIEFFNADGTRNKKLFKTKKCVLTGVSVDYTPNGYATFADGMPVEIRLQLSFQETSIISKTDIKDITELGEIDPGY